MENKYNSNRWLKERSKEMKFLEVTMKRKVLAALLAGVMVFSLTACGDKKDEKKMTQQRTGKQS